MPGALGTLPQVMTEEQDVSNPRGKPIARQFLSLDPVDILGMMIQGRGEDNLGRGLSCAL